MAKQQDTNEILVTEATKLLVEIAMGNGIITASQAVRAQEFITRSYRKSNTRELQPQAA